MYKLLMEQSIGLVGRINGPIMTVYTTLINILKYCMSRTIRLYNLGVGPLVE